MDTKSQQNFLGSRLSAQSPKANRNALFPFLQRQIPLIGRPLTSLQLKPLGAWNLRAIDPSWRRITRRAPRQRMLRTAVILRLKSTLWLHFFHANGSVYWPAAAGETATARAAVMVTVRIRASRFTRRAYPGP